MITSMILLLLLLLLLLFMVVVELEDSVSNVVEDKAPDDKAPDDNDRFRSNGGRVGLGF